MTRKSPTLGPTGHLVYKANILGPEDLVDLPNISKQTSKMKKENNMFQMNKKSTKPQKITK